ncbi:MAG: hypothetical protein Q4D14_07590 [Bacteroidales bacterium]|nr:hypothetical protein [Bacteroidales bacterium]
MSKAKIISIIAVCLVVILLGWGYFKFYFVFGEGVKAGQLNYVVHKGYIFKTNEGKLIQDGFKSKGLEKGIQNYEFEFSVANQSIADSLMRCTGKMVELHYKEYKGTLPWRGMQQYVVDSIYSVNE